MIMFAHVTHTELPWGLAWYVLGIASGILVSQLTRYWWTRRQAARCEVEPG